VADAEPEEETVVERVGEHACGVRRGHGVTRPDVRDPRRDADAVGRAEEDGAVGEDSRVPSPSGYQSVS
jgi:hypothetical protein